MHLEIQTIRTALKCKEKIKGRAIHIEDTEKLITEEIEMLKVVLHLVN